MDVDPKVIRTLEELTQKRLLLEADRQDLDTQYKADETRLKAAYSNRIAPISMLMAELDDAIWQLVQLHREALVKTGKQSFAIASATFQFRAQKAKLVPTDPDGIMAAARKLGVVSKIADPPVRKWTFNKQRFLAWLEAHASLSRYFRQYLTVTEGSESLSVKPNTGHPVFHDKERLTPFPFTIKKS